MRFSGVGTGGENNASLDRIFGYLLIWLQEMGRNGVPVFVFATASHLERILAELMRLGRFDEKFFFLPTPDECRAIATLHLTKHACMLADVDGRALADGDALAGALEGDAYRARIERTGEDARSLADDAPWDAVAHGYRAACAAMLAREIFDVAGAGRGARCSTCRRCNRCKTGKLKIGNEVKAVIVFQILLALTINCSHCTQ